MTSSHSNRGLRKLHAVVLASALSFGALTVPAAAYAVDEAPVAGATTSAGSVALRATSVEQGDFLWFDVSGLAEGTAVQVQLVNAGGTAVGSIDRTIGADGNTANPDGHTYRRILVPRGAAAGSYKVRVVAGAQTLAESGTVTVTAATTKVYNTGDHANGVEDLEVEQQGFWTFRAKGFKPNGLITATTVIRGNSVALTGQGQNGNRQWQLDANGDTNTADFTRVQLPPEVPVGTLPVTFSDGSTERTVNLSILQAGEYGVTVSATAEIGGTVHIRGTGFTHGSLKTQGSKVAIKIDDGNVIRLNTNVNSNRTVWWVVDADAQGNFEIDMPMPNGTTEGEHGSRKAFDPADGTFTLRFLTGLLSEGDISRSVLSSPITIEQATKTSVTFSPSKPAYNQAVTATVKVSSAKKTPTGTVALKINGKSYSGTLKSGAAKIKLNRAVAPGKRSVSVSYAGAKGFKKSSATTSITVTKAKPSVSLKLSKSKVKTSQRATANVTVKLPGSLKGYAYGKVTVYDGSKKIASKTLKASAKGKVSVKLPKLKAGTHKIKVRMENGTVQSKRDSSAKTLKVVR
ncbi:MAG: Ig-like domain-containing protein [Leucobacter sp.]